MFFSRITLEDKLGSAYEPYIFAALQSANVMVVVGTRPDHFNAVWVKNEWSRYLGLIKAGAKKTLIPAYRDMDPYDLPEAFSHLQAQDMGKLGFMQDLVRGIKKIVAASKPKQTAAAPEASGSGVQSTIVPLLRRAFLLLEDKDWQSAIQILEQVLNLDPENARAYIGKLWAEWELGGEEYLGTVFFTDNEGRNPLEGNPLYQRAVQFADDKYRATLQSYNTQQRERIKVYQQKQAQLKKQREEQHRREQQALREKQEKERKSNELAEQERQRKLKKKRIIGVTAFLVVFSLIFAFSVSAYRKATRLKRVYNQAVAAIADLDYITTYSNGRVMFGEENGTNKWIPLEVYDDRMLLILDYYIGTKISYHEVDEPVTWETCSLRKYLNEEYYNTFGPELRKYILETEVINNDNPAYGTSGGNTTRDKIFLLSSEEALRLFPSNSKRKFDVLFNKTQW